jgi:hypothetical protein
MIMNLGSCLLKENLAKERNCNLIKNAFIEEKYTHTHKPATIFKAETVTE